MARDIRTLISSELHEPKLISDTTAADAGKVITPLSGGTSELRKLTPDEVGINFYYLEWTVEESTSALALTAAADADLYTGTDYTQITSANLPGATVGEQSGITFDSTNYEVEIPSNGVYRVGFWTNFESDTATVAVGFKLTVDGTPVGTTAKKTLNNIGRIAHMSVEALQAFTAGQKVGISIASDTTANVTIDDLKAHIQIVEET